MRRNALTLALFGLLGSSVLAPAAHGFGGHRGQTYHYDGHHGYWASGYAHAARPIYSPRYVQRPVYYVHQPAYILPSRPVYVQSPAAWHPAVLRR